MAFEQRHLAWLNCKRRSIIFEFIKPEKQYKKRKKVMRIKQKIKILKQLELDDDM